ncbi:MAG: exosortase C-terminal domain/associated protein EpsI [Desulfovibrio sp.]
MKISWFRFLAVYALLLTAAGYVSLHHETAHTLPQPLTAFPTQLGEWRAVGHRQFSEALLTKLRPTDYLYRRYSGPGGKTVDVYIGYHDGAQGAGPIHSPKNCLPGNGWSEISSAPLELDVGRERIHLTQAVYRQNEQQELFLYWFMVRGQTLSTEVGLKLAEIANAVRYGQRGACFVRLSLPVADNPAASAGIAQSFLERAYPAICAFTSS